MNPRKLSSILVIPSILAIFSQFTTVAAKSNLSEDYDSLFLLVTILSVIVAVFVIGLWAYFIYKFRESNEVERKPLSHETTRKLEMTWTLVAVAIVIVLMIVSYPVLFQLDDNENLTGINGEDAEEIHVVGTSGYTWLFYTGGFWSGQSYIGGTLVQDRLEGYPVLDLKTDKAYKFIFESSGNLIHSFYVYDLNLKMDVVPGST
ncbi:MAG: cytochrome c oxidase subunit II transmembrane domain-containing protein, partial [Candidatus Kariarchaeaceae archaeon]